MGTIGQRIKTLRKNRKVSQKQLSEMLEITQPNISDYERSKIVPTINVLLKLEKIFDADLHWLLCGKKYKKHVKSKKNSVYFEKNLFKKAAETFFAEIKDSSVNIEDEKKIDILTEFYIYVYVAHQDGNDFATKAHVRVFLKTLGIFK